MVTGTKKKVDAHPAPKVRFWSDPNLYDIVLLQEGKKKMAEVCVTSPAPGSDVARNITIST